ncbi:MAG: WG repeat-containing protein [Rikenellaceae bacterium]
MNLSKYIETLSNPYGMFLTLGNSISLERKKDGDYDFYVENRIAYFKIRYKGQKKVMWCFLGDRDSARRRFDNLNLRFQSLNSEFICRWKFLHDEMLIFNNLSRTKSCDVVLQDSVEADSLSDFLTRCALNCDRKSMVELLENIALMAEEFYRKRVNFKGLDLKKIGVTKANKPIVALSCEGVVESQGERNNQAFFNDNKAFAFLASFIAVVCVVPQYFLCSGAMNIFSVEAKGNLIPVFKSFAQSINFSALTELLDSIYGGERAEINELISEIAHSDFDALAKEFEMSVVKGTSLSDYFASGKDATRPVCLRAENGMFYYVDGRSGEVLFDKEFQYAEDFTRSCAVVCLEEEFALIDTKGHFLIEPKWEDMSWFAAFGVVMAQNEGGYSLLNNRGEIISRENYDYMGDVADNGLLLVKKDRLYGYINTHGEQIIDCIYSNAYDFVGDKALVRLKGEDIYITV